MVGHTLEDTLKRLLHEPGNKTCADCGEKAPRYASVTIGVFLCNRCFGVHRAMGTHISRTRSVALDKWNPEQVEAMEKMGNEKAALIWEAKLPEGGRISPDASDHDRENFIRDKYERKKFCSEDNPPSAEKHAAVETRASSSGKTAEGLGTHISRTRSVTLDKWAEDQVEMMEKMGNEKAALLWEACVPEGVKIRSDASHTAREEFIRDKYEYKKFYKAPTPVKKAETQQKNTEPNTELNTEQKPAEADLLGGIASMSVNSANKSDPFASDPFAAFNNPTATSGATATSTAFGFDDAFSNAPQTNNAFNNAFFQSGGSSNTPNTGFGGTAPMQQQQQGFGFAGQQGCGNAGAGFGGGFPQQGMGMNGMPNMNMNMANQFPMGQQGFGNGMTGMQNMNQGFSSPNQFPQAFGAQGGVPTMGMPGSMYNMHQGMQPQPTSSGGMLPMQPSGPARAVSGNGVNNGFDWNAVEASKKAEAKKDDPFAGLMNFK